MTFVGYVRRAAEEETDEAGKPIPTTKRIVVFPAMELTLGVPCQALLLFDADFPEDIADGNVYVVQRQAAYRRPVQAKQLFVLTHTEARRVPLKEKRGKLRAVDLGEENEKIGPTGIRDELFGTVDDVVGAVLG